ncbi:MAG: HlyD family efflux transporter periplasmic adaptor subunit [Bacteroidia bacterium]|nr:HlyD family efflux transporter periplasmic adaptor subunit [Bacteroidia bacterium]
MNTKFLLILSLAALLSCEEKQAPADAYGNFEAREILVSSERAGKIMSFRAEEGQWLEAGQLIAVIDTAALQLQQEQLLAQINAVLSRSQDIAPQLAVFDSQLANLQREQKRITALVADSAATSQTLDEINGQIAVVNQQKNARLVQMKSGNRSVNSEVEPLRVQLALIQDQIRRSYVKAPEAGRVLVTYAEQSEITSPGKPLLKLANTKDMTLRVFISGTQLSEIAIGADVEVMFDESGTALGSLPGKVTWIADQAEFTPKSIQTREERVDLVYAAKISVLNADGKLKIGMPGEANW